MRRLILLLPASALLLAGCDGMRQAAAAHRKVAEEGIPFLSVNAGQAEAAQAAADPDAVPGKSGPPLPTSLGGDKENAVYTAPQTPPPPPR